MKIKTTTKQLRKKAYSFNRKRTKKIIKGYIKAILIIIKLEANAGKFLYHKVITESNDHFCEILIAARWLRRYSKLNIVINQLVETHEREDSMRIYYDRTTKINLDIKWD